MTFHSTSEHMLRAVAEVVDKMEAANLDVHTISLELNGQHGEFDLEVLATDEDLEAAAFEGVAFRGGGVDGLRTDV